MFVCVCVEREENKERKERERETDVRQQRGATTLPEAHLNPMRYTFSQM